MFFPTEEAYEADDWNEARRPKFAALRHEQNSVAEKNRK